MSVAESRLPGSRVIARTLLPFHWLLCRSTWIWAHFAVLSAGRTKRLRTLFPFPDSIKSLPDPQDPRASAPTWWPHSCRPTLRTWSSWYHSNCCPPPPSGTRRADVLPLWTLRCLFDWGRNERKRKSVRNTLDQTKNVTNWVALHILVPSSPSHTAKRILIPGGGEVNQNVSIKQQHTFTFESGFTLFRLPLPIATL